MEQDEIARLNESMEEKRAVLARVLPRDGAGRSRRGKEEEKGEKGVIPKPLGSAFIQCNLQMGAHVLAQCVSYHQVRFRLSAGFLLWGC